MRNHTEVLTGLLACELAEHGCTIIGIEPDVLLTYFNFDIVLSQPDKTGRTIPMNNVFAHMNAIPTSVGAIGYVRVWKELTSKMSAQGADRVSRGHCVLAT